VSKNLCGDVWWRLVVSLLVVLATACSREDGATSQDSGADAGDIGNADRSELDGMMDAPSDAPQDEVVDGGRTGRCTSSAECASSPDRPACDTSTGLCVGCLATPEDTCPSGRYCDPGRRCMAGCRNDGECAGRGASLRCDAVSHACVGCVADRDCALGAVCSEGVCVPGCTAARGCPAGESCCVSACFTLGSDALNCGACGHACATGQACCGGRCVSTSMDAAHCGACGVACALPNATPVCAASACAATACAAGFGDCDRDAANGCEVAVAGSLNHCGACGRMCPGGPHATATCAMGECGLRCDAGFGDCDGNPTNGCETDLNVTATACSSCTTVCAIPNATPACVAGRCAIGACVPGFADCDGLVANGCETATTTGSNCGMCGVTCRAGEVCSIDRCGSSCSAGTTLCGGACFNLSADPSNCGTCGRICPTLASARATCAGGACAFTCNAGYGDCDGDAANGCETNLSVRADHCGACGRLCPAPANAGGTCADGTCGLGACRAGFGDCDRDAANGCETSLSTTVTSCGACGTTCAAAPNAAAACVGGSCGLGACRAGFGDCDGSAANGCETTLATSAAHCGACGNTCPTPANAAPTCAGGACGFSCNPGFGDCDRDAANGCETNLSTTVASCGACGTACPTPANGAATCAGGVCGLGTCRAGFGNCDGLAANGCEATLATSGAHCGACGNVCPAGTTCSGGACATVCAPPTTFCAGACYALLTEANHCGACGNVCPAAANASPACASGVCSFTCNASFGDCDGSVGNGCETALGANPMNCGRCGNTCPTPANATPTCAGGACGFTCNAGFHNCGGMCVSNASAATCGASCAACPVPANASATCDGSSCGFACRSGFVRSGTACVSDGTCPSAPPYPTAGLIGAYEFEVDARDASAARNDGTVLAPVSFVAGLYCQAALFGGTGSIDLPDRRLQAVTVSARVRYDGTATSYQPVVDAWSNDENYLLGIGYVGGALRYTAAFHDRPDASNAFYEIHVQGTGAVVRGEWHHVAMTYDGMTLRIYVDGAQQGSVSTVRSSYASPMVALPDLRIGRSVREGVTSPVAVDHLLIYNRALSAAEIGAL
jgi:hypothetical protein